jgi:hypothetical protein
MARGKKMKATSLHLVQRYGFREITLWIYVPHKPNKPTGYNGV